MIFSNKRKHLEQQIIYLFRDRALLTFRNRSSVCDGRIFLHRLRIALIKQVTP